MATQNFQRRQKRLSQGQDIYIKPSQDDYGRVFHFYVEGEYNNGKGVRAMAKTERSAQLSVNPNCNSSIEALMSPKDDEITREEYYAY